MPNYKVILEYDGSRYHGWQVQPGRPTVEGAFRQALLGATGEAPLVTAAGRTDAGVHALGQCANFRLARAWAPTVLGAAVNAHLPDDIVVRDASVVDDSFHARYSARTRQYRYRLCDGPSRPALGRQYLWHVGRPLDVARMRAAAGFLLGRRDLATFGRSPKPGAPTVRTLHSLEVNRQGDIVEVDAVADAFLYGMMRRVVGALVAVGLRRMEPDQLRRMVDDRGVLPVSAPPRGLVQVAVQYENV